MTAYQQHYPEKNVTSVLNAPTKKHLKLTEINYRNNRESDYTEKMQELEQNFDYEANKDHYWVEPEFSLFYGTPLYEQASPAQKLALNHLYWVGMYNLTAASEANTILYNQITSSVFFSLGNTYETLCLMLDMETTQERHHSHAFRSVGNATETALLGKVLIGTASRQEESKVIHKGLAHRLAPGPVKHIFSLNWGSTPFLASQYYSLRYIANLMLKNKEYSHSQYCRKLEKQGEYIPAPSALCFYHFLDESFHTTTSLLIAQDLYKDFAKPSAYEVFVANMVIYMAQKQIFSSLSGAIPALYTADKTFAIPLSYQLLQTPLFGMSASEALGWMQKCFCQEHEGFHLTLKHHQRLHGEMSRFFSNLEFLWPVNQEWKLMAKGGSISQAIADNVGAVARFERSLDLN